MDAFRVIEIKKSVWEGNDRNAAILRSELEEKGVFLLNLMSSPGSGKTTTLVRTIEALEGSVALGVMEADIDSDVDAATVSRAGARVVQLHTGGMCHLDAEMTRQGLDALASGAPGTAGGAAEGDRFAGLAGIDCVVLENIGNLICTADYDTGAARNVMILSVPEGDDKPLKYPNIFKVCDVLLVNKIDVAPYFDFSLSALEERVKALNPDIRIIPVSAKTGEGIPEWAEWLKTEISEWRKNI
ncbi:MAG TPA: hydrogenase nickel incorporation protein HypB [Treponemataceae bacterium]|nr:hydrogenase nickel incorporation protein HypB [Treponemataceae bacterium]